MQYSIFLKNKIKFVILLKAILKTILLGTQNHLRQGVIYIQQTNEIMRVKLI